MSDLALTDMEPFMQRHDRGSRRAMAALICISLLVSAAAFGYGLAQGGSLAALPGRLWFGILFYPVPIIALALVGAFWARKRPVRADGSLPMNPEDARDAARIARVGAIYVAGISLVLIASQLIVVLNVLHALSSLGLAGNWLVGRTTLVAAGLLVIYFGNAWPRFPATRRPEEKPALQRKFHRFLGWTLVVHGLAFVLAGLLLPPVPAIFAGGASAIGFSMLLFTVGAVVVLHHAMKAPAAVRS